MVGERVKFERRGTGGRCDEDGEVADAAAAAEGLPAADTRRIPDGNTPKLARRE